MALFSDPSAALQSAPGWTSCTRDEVQAFCYGTTYPDTRDLSSHVLNQYLLDPSCSWLVQLDGSFLIILCTRDQIRVCRDRHGTGPSFYFSSKYFSTSLMELRDTCGGVAPNPEGICAYLRCGYVPASATSIQGIQKLAGGHMLIHDLPDGKQRIQTLHPFEDFLRPVSSQPLEELSEQYGALHLEAIRKRIAGHNSIGILLSGGYDSGSNLMALRKVWNGEIHSFSIGFKGNQWSELPVAREMSKRFETRHSEYELDGSEVRYLPELVQSLGDPFVEGGLMVNHAAMKMAAANRPDMILGGDGSDQYFGTSGREVALHLLARKTLVYHPIRMAAQILDTEWVERGGLPYRIRFHLKRISDIMAGDQFGFSEKQIRNFLSKPELFSPHIVSRSKASNFDQLYTAHFYECDLLKTIDQVILYKASKVAEMFGNTLSFPYLDNTLFEFLKTVPVAFKCKGDSLYQLARGRGTAKFLLKHHYKPFLPESVTGKKKQGGFAPMALFFKDEHQRRHLMDFILESALCKDFLNKKAVADWLRGYDQEAERTGEWFWYQQARSFQLFNLLTLAVWWEIFMARNNTPSL